MKCRRGFTMVDIMIAFFVVTVGVLVCYTLFVGGRRLSSQAQVQTAAYQVAREQLENVRTLKSGNRKVTTSTAFTIPSSVKSLFPNEQLTGSYSIASYGSYTSPPLQQICVKVNWKRTDVPGSITSSVQLDTLVADEPGK